MVSTKMLERIAARATVTDQYKRQLLRVKDEGNQTNRIEAAVNQAIANLPKAAKGSLVIYGDPQSGKTEMMICLTARLLDEGHAVIVHLMNDSVDLLSQNLDRFRLAGLAPAPRSASDLANSPFPSGYRAVLFCKKNSRDLQKLIAELASAGPIIVVDDEADYATPNRRINQQERTKINALISKLLGNDGTYIGVTATPARLNLNNTFDNKPETWVRFKPHDGYCGQDKFFPLRGTLPYRLTMIKGPGTDDDAKRALARFLVTVAYLNTAAVDKGEPEANYTFLVHTSGKKEDHKHDREVIESAMTALESGKGDAFTALLKVVYEEAGNLYPDADAENLTTYVAANASRKSLVVLNSARDRKSAGDKPTEPTCPFTVIIGGNIVSRGVTFPNLLAMFFTRDVKTKLKQDTYIQRARMFGGRGKYLKHFELTIPEHLYADWHRCFIFHRLALESIENNKASPVWMGDDRIAIADSSSIDRGTVDLNKGEMSFQIFECPDPAKLDDIIALAPTKLATLKALADAVGDGLPQFLIEYLRAALRVTPDTLAIHNCSSIAGYRDSSSTDKDAISRTKGFMGNPQLELSRFPNAIHHLKIFYNDNGKARVFYKSRSGAQFVQNLK